MPFDLLGSLNIARLLQNIKTFLTAQRSAPPILKPLTEPVVRGAQAEAQSVTPIPDSRQEKLREFLQSQVPYTTPEEHYPAYGMIPKFYEAEQQYNRPGLGTFLSLQSFNESILGRTGSNLFGVRPPSGNQPQTFEEALQYQTSPAVLSGGVGGKLNILRGKTGQITPQEIEQLYSSYNPNSLYLEQLLRDYLKIEGR